VERVPLARGRVASRKASIWSVRRLLQRSRRFAVKKPQADSERRRNQVIAPYPLIEVFSVFWSSYRSRG
jgi:hypothetical protein